MKLQTYSFAHSALINGLADRGWKVERNTKVTHATSPSGNVRIYFKPQGAHCSLVNDGAHAFHSLGAARSMWLDTRKCGVEVLVSVAASRALEAGVLL